MKKYVIILLTVSLFIFLTGCNKVSQAEYDTVKNELDAIKTQYESVKSEIDTTKSQYESVVNERDQLKGQVEELQKKIDDLSKEVSELKEKPVSSAEETAAEETVSETETKSSTTSTDDGDYYEKGKEIGDKTAEALGSIDWDENKSKAREKGKDVAEFFNNLMGD